MSSLLSLEDARAKLLASIGAVGEHEDIPVAEAIGRTVATDVLARVDLPPADNSAMDGYALAAGNEGVIRSDTVFRVVRTVMAGDPPGDPLAPGEAVRIMTGALVPAGGTSVAMQEIVTAAPDGTIQLDRDVAGGESIRRKGSDIRTRERLASPGDVVSVALAGLLAAQGMVTVPVIRRIRVAMLATGDELKLGGQPLAPGEIYESNRIIVSGLLRSLPVSVTDLGVLPDNEEQLAASMMAAAADHDLIVSTGGVSVGERDYTRRVLEQHGDVNFWKVAVKPGKPLAFGRLGDAWFLGLPGNPVSALVTARLFLAPAVQKLAAQRPDQPFMVMARVSEVFRKEPGRAEFQRAVLKRDSDGHYRVSPLPGQGSHQLADLSRASAFCYLPSDSAGAEPGEWVETMPLGPELTGRY